MGQPLFPHHAISIRCKTCGGSGLVREIIGGRLHNIRCHACGGLGEIVKEYHLSFVDETKRTGTDMETQQEILKGYNEIRKFLRISTNKAKNLADMGAPVTVDKIGRPRANKQELWRWFQQNPTVM